MLATLRQRRYLGLFGVALLIAVVCGLAGTWQIARFEQKHRANHELRTNNNDRVDPVDVALGPAARPTSTGALQKFRHVTATGQYLPDRQTLVRGQTVNSDVGYLVVTPLRTDSGVLLVVRGFVVQTGIADSTPTVPAAPTGTVSVTARLEAADTKPDRYGALPGNQVESVNAAAQARRLGAAGLERLRRAAGRPARHGRPEGHPDSGPVQSGRRRGRAAACGLRRTVVPVRRARAGRPVRAGGRREAPRRR